MAKTQQMQQTLTQYEVEYNAKADEADELVIKIKERDERVNEINQMCTELKSELQHFKEKNSDLEE